MIINKKYAGLIWAMIIWCLYFGAVFLTTKTAEGNILYIYNIIIKILFCTAAFIAVRKIYERKAAEIFSKKNSGKALLTGIGFTVFLIYYLIITISGLTSFKTISATQLTLTIVSYAVSVLFEEILFRVLILEGYHSSENKGWKVTLAFAAVNFTVYGAVHISGRNAAYSFLLSGTIGLSMSVIYMKTRNITIPLLLQSVYCMLSVIQNISEWGASEFLIRMLSIYYFIVSVMGVLSSIMLFKDDPDIQKMLDLKKENAE